MKKKFAFRLFTLLFLPALVVTMACLCVPTPDEVVGDVFDEMVETLEVSSPTLDAVATAVEDAGGVEGIATSVGDVDMGSEAETVFPLPPNPQNMMVTGGGSDTEGANFQVEMTLEEVMEFYRAELTAQGMTERTILTTMAGGTFNLVFDGADNGKAVVIQGVDLSNGTINVNIRYEDV